MRLYCLPNSRSMKNQWLGLLGSEKICCVFLLQTVCRGSECLAVQTWWCIAQIWPPSGKLFGLKHYNCHSRLWYSQTEYCWWCSGRSCWVFWIQCQSSSASKGWRVAVLPLSWSCLYGVTSKDPDPRIWGSWLSMFPRCEWGCALLPAVSYSPRWVLLLCWCGGCCPNFCSVYRLLCSQWWWCYLQI